MKNIILSLIILTVLIGGYFMYQNNNQSLLKDNNIKACTEEAKLCGDGSYVGRVGPNCEFAPCPEGKNYQETASDETCASEGQYLSDVQNEGYQRCCDGLVESFNPKDGETAKCVKANLSKPCTKEYAPVCGQPPMPTCPEGLNCIQVMPKPKTYSNKCLLEKENAKFLYKGECNKKAKKPQKKNENKEKNCAFEYKPVCAEIDTGIRCITDPCPSSVKKTFNNRCEAEKAGAKILFDGNCDFNKNSFDKPPKNCISWFDGCNTCGVENGKITQCTQMTCEAYRLPKCLKFK